jgi:acyl-ACP thioesterase
MRSVGLGRSMATWVATSAGSASPAAIIKSLFASFSSEKEESFLVLF